MLSFPDDLAQEPLSSSALSFPFPSLHHCPFLELPWLSLHPCSCSLLFSHAYFVSYTCTLQSSTFRREPVGPPFHSSSDSLWLSQYLILHRFWLNAVVEKYYLGQHFPVELSGNALFTKVNTMVCKWGCWWFAAHSQWATRMPTWLPVFSIPSL